MRKKKESGETTPQAEGHGGEAPRSGRSAVTAREIPRGIPSMGIYEGLGVASPKLSYWVTKGVIKPSGREGGRAFSALWTLRDLIEIKLLLALREVGVPLRYAASLIDVIRRDNLHFQIQNVATNGKTVWANVSKHDLMIFPEDDLVYLDWDGIINECTELFEMVSLGINVEDGKSRR